MLSLSLVLSLVIRLVHTLLHAQNSSDLPGIPAVTFPEAAAAWFWLIVWFLFSIAAFELAIEASGSISSYINNSRSRNQRRAIFTCGSLAMVCTSYLLPNTAVQMAIDDVTQFPKADIIVSVTVWAGILALTVTLGLLGVACVQKSSRRSRDRYRTSL